MHKAKDCLGLTVISEKTGQLFGKVSDIICSSDLDTVLSLLVIDKSDNELKECFSSWVTSLGRDAVIVNTAELPIFDKDKENYIFLTKLKGLHIVDSNGTELGELVDVLFEFPFYKVWGLEVSEGLIGDLLTGRRVIKKEAVKKVSKDCILIDL